MQRGIYLRPTGLLPAPAGEGDLWGGLPLAGGWLCFTAIEIRNRRPAAGERDGRIFSLGEFSEREWGRDTLPAADLFEAFRRPRGRLVGLTLDRPRIMGIVNLTPDSFSDGGRLTTVAAAVAHGLRLVEEGADILDLGAESTRPGSDPVSLDDELRRLLPVLAELRARSDVVISVDTRKAEVMRRAAEAGADILNDVSALSHDPDAVAAAAEAGLPVVLMHALGDPKTMQDNPVYEDVLLDVMDYLERRIAAARAAGIPAERLIVDPGIGFGKTVEQNLALMSGLAMLHGLGVPVLLGASRKRFIGRITGVEAADGRVAGSVGAALAGVAQGAQIVRVHDVAATRQAVDVWMAATTGRLAAAD
ncbi:MAG: dihydropteroate synthase [Hyphomicrobiaceae bacterium]